MTLTVDASVFVKWFVEEERSRAARELIGGDLHAPDLILAETYSALSKRARRGVLLDVALPDILESIRRSTRLTELGLLIDMAARISREVGHSIYDCVYLAAAARSELTLMTADDRQFAAGRRARISVRLL